MQFLSCLISGHSPANIYLMADVVECVRQLLQDFIAPELRELKGDVKRVENKLDSAMSRLETKFSSETKRLEDKIDSQSQQFRTDFKRLEDKMDAGFGQLRSMIENANLRAELEATRDIANLRERVTRLEVERGTPRQ
jgi:uncharacterized protein Yka (UPF0111/DUF47 family)